MDSFGLAVSNKMDSSKVSLERWPFTNLERFPEREVTFQMSFSDAQAAL